MIAASADPSAAGQGEGARWRCKRLVNTSLPPDVELGAGRDARIASLGRPAARDGIKALIARGFRRPGDVENRLGYHLGQLVRQARDVVSRLRLGIGLGAAFSSRDSPGTPRMNRSFENARRSAPPPTDGRGTFPAGTSGGLSTPSVPSPRYGGPT